MAKHTAIRLGVTTAPVGSVVSFSAGRLRSSGFQAMAKTSGATSARLAASTSAAMTSPRYSDAVAPDAQGICKAFVAGLQPDTLYYYAWELGGGLDLAKVGRLRTAPAGAASVKLVFSACHDRGQVASSNAYSSMRSHNPLIWICTGDLGYSDITTNSQSAYRTMYDTHLQSSDAGPLHAEMPWAYTWSDHDSFGGNNGVGTSGSGATARPAGQVVYRQYVPTPSLPVNDGIYHTFRLTPRIRVIVTDNRSFKTIQSATDDANKTVLGTTQKTWFKGLIDRCREPLILWVGDQPWTNMTGADDEWANYDTERQELGSYIAASGKNVILLAGDMHAVAADDGTNSPGNITVFQAAPVGNLFSVKGTYTSGPYPTSGASPVQQYGLLEITDSGGTSISAAFTGYSAASSGAGTVRVQPTPKTFTVASAANNPSGITMPSGNLPADTASPTGWVQVVAEDFNTPCAEGSFLSTYTSWSAYPTSYNDTSGVGTYDPGILSVAGGKLRKRIHTNGSGSVRVAAPYPNATNPLTYGRYDVCFRADYLPRYKTAWLLWPTSENWPNDGEIDWPEGGLDDTIDAFMHRMNGTSGGDQDAYTTSQRHQDWHVATIIWSSVQCQFLLDGEIVGTSTSRIPSTPMRWILQTETNLSGIQPDPATTGYVEIDWAVAYRLGP